MATRKTKPKIIRVRPKKGHVVHVALPPDHKPIIAHHPDQNVVEVVPVPDTEHPMGWWEYLFGPNKD